MKLKTIEILQKGQEKIKKIKRFKTKIEETKK
jgi:hypothetical protein